MSWFSRFKGRKPDQPEAPPLEEPSPAPAMPAPVALQPPPPSAPPPAAALSVEEAEPESARSGGWFSRLRAGLSRSTDKLSMGLSTVLSGGRALDEETLQELEEVLIQADLGPITAEWLLQELKAERFGARVTDQEVREHLAERIAQHIGHAAEPLMVDPARRPFVILVVGVNGAGKTTTIGKLALQYRQEGHSVLIGAGDTFRAAAIEQLGIWGERAGVPVISRPQGSDAAGLAFDALEQAQKEGHDILLIDTAGRLQNKQNLMQELTKIRRVMQKLDPEAPHATLLVLDATTGQNAVSQVEVFRELVQVTGLVVTKLDGSARGGVLVQIADISQLPIHFIGVGEGIEDLRPFTAPDFARSLLGLA